MKIVVGSDLEEFKRYYKKLALDKEWRGTFGFTEELDTSWEKVLEFVSPFLSIPNTFRFKKKI